MNQLLALFQDPADAAAACNFTLILSECRALSSVWWDRPWGGRKSHRKMIIWTELESKLTTAFLLRHNIYFPSHFVWHTLSLSLSPFTFPKKISLFWYMVMYKVVVAVIFSFSTRWFLECRALWPKSGAWRGPCSTAFYEYEIRNNDYCM